MLSGRLLLQSLCLLQSRVTSVPRNIGIILHQAFGMNFVCSLCVSIQTAYRTCACLLHVEDPSGNAGDSLQVGICAVGISSVLSGQGSASAEVTQSQILLGMALIVCSQVLICLCVSVIVLPQIFCPNTLVGMHTCST